MNFHFNSNAKAELVAMNFSMFKTILLLLGTFLTSCDNSGQQLLNKLTKTAATEDAPDASPVDTETDGVDSETANEPVMVGGAYLICIFEEKVSVMRCSYAEEDGSLKDIPLGISFHINQYISSLKGDLMGTVKVTNVQTFFELPITDSKSLPPVVLVEMMFNDKSIRKDVAALTIIPAATLEAAQNPLPLACAGGFSTNGYCFYYGALGASCTASCTNRRGVNIEGTRWANNSRAACGTVFSGLGAPTYGRGTRDMTYRKARDLDAGGDTGCTVETDDGNSRGRAAGRWIITDIPDNYPYADGFEASSRRACACNK